MKTYSEYRLYNVIFKKIVYQVTIYWKSGLLNGYFFIPITLDMLSKNFYIQ